MVCFQADPLFTLAVLERLACQSDPEVRRWAYRRLIRMPRAEG